LRGVKGGQHHAKSRRMLGLNTRDGSRLEVTPQPFVPEGLDHVAMIARCATRNIVAFTAIV